MTDNVEFTTIAVPITAARLAILRDIASGQNVTAEVYLAELARCAVAARETRDEIVSLHEQRKTDAEIARALGYTNAQVAQRRRRYGLPANRKAL